VPPPAGNQRPGTSLPGPDVGHPGPDAGHPPHGAGGHRAGFSETECRRPRPPAPVVGGDHGNAGPAWDHQLDLLFIWSRAANGRLPQQPCTLDPYVPDDGDHDGTSDCGQRQDEGRNDDSYDPP
jgi:hypothetical protein